MSALSGDQGAALARRMLDRISRKQDGTVAAANTANRKRMVLGNAMDYAREIGAVPASPLKQVKWTKPRKLRAVDPAVVINSSQARRFLAAVGRQGPTGERLKAFFGCMYYAALRPEEVIDLRRAQNLTSLPEQGWGELRLTNSQPRSGAKWTDSGKSRERRELKHRAVGDTRLVPVHPELVTLLRDHLERFGTGPGDRVFAGPRGGIIAEWSYLKVFHAAREEALAETEAQSPLMGRPYDLRHAAVSTWLNAGVPAAQVAEWAGHSTDVLLRVYVKCIAGQQGEAKRRIEDAMREPEPAPARQHRPGTAARGRTRVMTREPASGQTLARIWHSHPHRAASGRTQPHTLAHGERLPQTAKGAGQPLFLQVNAEGEGFEPSRTVTSPSGFQDRRHRPLGEPSWLRKLPPASSGRPLARDPSAAAAPVLAQADAGTTFSYLLLAESPRNAASGPRDRETHAPGDGTFRGLQVVC